MNYKERIERLIHHTKQEDYLNLEYFFNAFVDYVNSVVRFTWQIPMIQEKYAYDVEQRRVSINKLDVARHLDHENAIAMLRALNRHSLQVVGEVFADVDTDDRNAVANFCGDFVNTLFNQGIEGGIDAAVEMADEEEYNPFFDSYLM